MACPPSCTSMCPALVDACALVEQIHFAFALGELLQDPECQDPELRNLAVACLLAQAPFSIRAALFAAPRPARPKPQEQE